MVRLAKLLPQSVDSEQVGKDVEELANKSSKGECPLDVVVAVRTTQ
jgi:hypothetical protein